LLLNATVVVLSEQILWEFGVAVAEGIGFTVTVKTTFDPLQPPIEGVIV
jgi:hypothetical protein